MKTNKNIDRLFQEKLKDMEITPPDIVWDTIEKALADKKKRRIIPLWLRYGAAAAILLLLAVGTVSYLDSSKVIEPAQIIVDTDNENTPIINENTIVKPIENSTNDVIVLENTDEKSVEKGLITSQNPEAKEVQNSTMNNTVVASTTSKEKTTLESENTVAANNNSTVSNDTISLTNKNNLVIEQNSKKEETTIAITAQKKETEKGDNIEETLIADVFEDLEKEIETIDKKWSVASVVAPIYFNSFNADESSPIDPEFNNNPKESNTTFSYGIKVGYQLNKKFSFQSGVNIVNLSYSTNDIYVTTRLINTKMSNVKYQPSASVVQVSSSSPSLLSKNEIASTSFEEGKLNQEFDYVEIPLEVKYNLLGGKFGVSLVGGFSTLFLNNNQISVISEDITIDLGEASNINSVNFTGNFGIDLDYKFNKNMFINVAPTIKIQTNTFSENAQGFSPYFFGIYTGLNYKF